MLIDLPEFQTEKARIVTDRLSQLCYEMEKGNLNTDEKIERFNEILKDANDRRYYEYLTNEQRKEEFRKMVRFVHAIYYYFMSSEFYYRIIPEVQKANIKFFSY